MSGADAERIEQADRIRGHVGEGVARRGDVARECRGEVGRWNVLQVR